MSEPEVDPIEDDEDNVDERDAEEDPEGDDDLGPRDDGGSVEEEFERQERRERAYDSLSEIGS